MRVIMLFSLMAFFIAGSGISAARGRKAPPPAFFGGNTGSWLGDGGNGPIFGFDFPWGKDFPFGGGGISDPGFTGYLGWEPLGGDGGNGGTGTSSGDTVFTPCTGICRRATNGARDCIPLCFCRRYTQGAFPEWDTICERDYIPSLYTGIMCYIYLGGCPGDPE